MTGRSRGRCCWAARDRAAEWAGIRWSGTGQSCDAQSLKPMAVSRSSTRPGERMIVSFSNNDPGPGDDLPSELAEFGRTAWTSMTHELPHLGRIPGRFITRAAAAASEGVLRAY